MVTLDTSVYKYVQCPVCGQESLTKGMDPHHPAGRTGDNILNYMWVHKACHIWIHNNKEEARKRGFLLPK